MSLNPLERRWRMIKHNARSKWAPVAEREIKQVAAKTRDLLGKLQTRYGVLDGNVGKQLDAWITKVELLPGAAQASENIADRGARQHATPDVPPMGT